MARLDTEYVDLLLIHAPGDVPIVSSIGAMNELREEGAVRRVGVSNFSIEELEAAMAASRTSVLTNQIEYHPPKASFPEHRRENWDVLDLELSGAEMGRIFEAHIGLDEELRSLLGY